MTRRARKRLVVSGVNLVEGGTLRVLQDFLVAASQELDSSWDIIALVHSREKLKPSRAKLIEVPWPKRSWLGRMFFEWGVSARLAQRLKPDVWFAIHDITPRVGEVRKVVYCHNPMPFYRPSIKEARYDIKAWLFSKLYGYLYGLGIKSNSIVVVQQNWIRHAFQKRYGIDHVMVAYPRSAQRVQGENAIRCEVGPYQFIFPSLARPFKNFEVICKAAEILERQGVPDFRVILTIDAKENAYARSLISKYSHVESIRFIGRQSFDQMFHLYEASQCLIFPSHIETWGLPITEAKAYGLDILAASEKYAYETVGSYDKVAFFDTNSEKELAQKMLGLIQGTLVTEEVVAVQPEEPFVEGWESLVKAICIEEKI